MQSTGQACTHNSSLVQLSVMTYAICRGNAFGGPSSKQQKTRGKTQQMPRIWVGDTTQLRDATLAEYANGNARGACRTADRSGDSGGGAADLPLVDVRTDGRGRVSAGLQLLARRQSEPPRAGRVSGGARRRQGGAGLRFGTGGGVGGDAGAGARRPHHSGGRRVLGIA